MIVPLLTLDRKILSTALQGAWISVNCKGSFNSIELFELLPASAVLDIREQYWYIASSSTFHPYL